MSISKLPFLVFSFNKRLKPFNKIQENIYEIKINAFFLTLFNNQSATIRQTFMKSNLTLTLFFI